MDLQGETFRDRDGRKTLRFQCNGKPYFAKLHRGVGWREIIKNFASLRLPVLGARNEWLAIQRLDGLGIATMRLAAYGSRGWNHLSLQKSCRIPSV